MKHEHVFERAHWLRSAGTLVLVPTRVVETTREPNGWVCICGEQGYEVPA